MLGQFKLELSNPSLSAEPEVSGHTPSSGQSLPLRRPVGTDVHPHRFQGTVEDPMPCGSGYAHTKSVSHDSARSALGAGSAQPQGSLREYPEVAQDPQPSSGPGVSFVPSGAEFCSAQEPEDEDEDARDSVFEPQVFNKTLNRLFSFVYDKFVESRPLSDSSAPPLCDLESYFSISEPQASGHPRLRIYSRVNELVAQSSERATKLAHKSKPLFKVILLRWKIFLWQISPIMRLLVS